MNILDGYTLTARISVEEWPEFDMTITYRRALADKVDTFLERKARSKAESTMALWKDQLIAWDLKHKPEDEQAILCTEPAWRALPYTVREKISEYIAGFSRESTGKN